MSKKIPCWICGKMHEYCPTCEKLGGWRMVADTPECFQIYTVLKEYESEIITQDEAVKQFAEQGVSPEKDLSWIIPPVEKVIRGIIGEKEKESAKTTKKSKLFKDE